MILQHGTCSRPEPTPTSMTSKDHLKPGACVWSAFPSLRTQKSSSGACRHSMRYAACLCGVSYVTHGSPCRDTQPCQHLMHSVEASLKHDATTFTLFHLLAITLMLLACLVCNHQRRRLKSSSSLAISNEASKKHESASKKMRVQARRTMRMGSPWNMGTPQARSFGKHPQKGGPHPAVLQHLASIWSVAFPNDKQSCVAYPFPWTV